MTKFQCHIFFPSQDMTLTFAMTEEGIEGKSEIQKFEYLENEKNFLDEVKSNFQLFKDYHLLNKRKIEDTSFKLS